LVLHRYLRFIAIGTGKGSTRCAHPPTVDLRRAKQDPRARFYIEREAIIAFAGTAAEELLTNKRDPHALDSDFDTIFALCGGKKTRSAETVAYGRWLYERAVTLLLRHRREVEALASALLERSRLTGAEARSIFRAARKSNPKRRTMRLCRS